IWSVSTLLRRKGTPTPVCWVIFSMVGSSSDQGRLGGRGEVGRCGQGAPDGGGGSDQRRDEVRAATLALAPFEVAVRRRGRALAGPELIRVHPETHRAPGVAPFGAEVEEDLVQPLGLGLEPDAGGARHHEDR